MESIRRALFGGYNSLVVQVRQQQPHTQQQGITVAPELSANESREIQAETHIFFRLPPEIRQQIYRLLLAPKDAKGWIHPAILECSRRFNEDGTYILYCENIFKLEWFIGNRSLLQVWEFSSQKFGLISRMTVARNIHAERINYLLPKFPSLWEIEIHLGNDAKKGAALLETVKVQLGRIRRVILVLLIISYNHEHALDLTKADPLDMLRVEYSRGYGKILDGFLKREMQVNLEALTGTTWPPERAARKLRLTFEQ